MAKKKSAQAEYILDDLSRNDDKQFANKALRDKYKKDWQGHAECAKPENQDRLINFTGPLGSTSGIFYSLMFQLRKWMYIVQKANEWIEISPVHQQYYQLTHKQKQEIEAHIKASLGSVAQAVSDLELLEHDLRRYREFLDYFNYDYNKETGDVFEIKEPDKKKEKEEWEKEKKSGEHSLKALFMDQVDYHVGSTGQGPGRMSMSFMQQQNIMPTIVQDFFEMNSTDDLDKAPRLKSLPVVEKNMLRTKWNAYHEWKKLFGSEIMRRFKNIFRLVKSREASVESYREWLKPYIVRHKLLEEGFSSDSVAPYGGRRGMTTSFIHSSGQAIASDGIVIWAWREYASPELFRTPGELIAKAQLEGVVPWDKWTKDNLIFNKEQGLVVKHNWIDDEWVNKKIEYIQNTDWLNPNRPYYSFFEIRYLRTNIRFATGTEIEDAMYFVNHILMSQNVLFVKLLELLAKQEEMERYVNSLLGLPETGEITSEAAIAKAKEPAKAAKSEKPPLFGSVQKSASDFLKYFEIPFEFAKRGPYERDFDHRITKTYMKPMGAERYMPVIGFIKEKIGFAQ